MGVRLRAVSYEQGIGRGLQRLKVQFLPLPEAASVTLENLQKQLNTQLSHLLFEGQYFLPFLFCLSTDYKCFTPAPGRWFGAGYSLGVLLGVNTASCTAQPYELQWHKNTEIITLHRRSPEPLYHTHFSSQ